MRGLQIDPSGLASKGAGVSIMEPVAKPMDANTIHTGAFAGGLHSSGAAGVVETQINFLACIAMYGKTALNTT